MQCRSKKHALFSTKLKCLAEAHTAGDTQRRAHPHVLPQKEWAAGREVASALLELFLTAEETAEVKGAWSLGAVRLGWHTGNLLRRGWVVHVQACPLPPTSPMPILPLHASTLLQAGEQAGFKHLLSLHAFVVTDVELCMPPKDPFKFVRSLAPYLKVSAAGVWAGSHLTCTGGNAASVLFTEQNASACEARTLCGQRLALHFNPRLLTPRHHSRQGRARRRRRGTARRRGPAVRAVHHGGRAEPAEALRGGHAGGAAGEACAALQCF